MAFKPKSLTRLQAPSSALRDPRGLPTQPSSASRQDGSAAPFKPGAAFYSTGAHRVFTPLDATGFFDEIPHVKTPRGSFQIYTKGSSGPRLVLLHGGGHSGASWACFAAQITQLCECQVLAYDARGHGATTVDGDEHDLSLDTQCQDLAAILAAVTGEGDAAKNIVIGHSMGGAVAAHACQRQLIPNLSGLIVIDVVEGTAMSALSGMMRFLRSRPVTFETQEAGIKWALRNGQLRNCESARVSIPPQLMPATAKMVNDRTSRSISNALAEEDEDAESTKSQPTQSSSSSSAAAAAAADQGYTWRVDLSKSAPYWEEWFRGLSKTFLSVPGPKMLMLAGIDRLDKDLTIGQMQGQFQLQVIPNAGHCVHEDAPGQAGAAVAEFLKRYSLLV